MDIDVDNVFPISSSSQEDNEQVSYGSRIETSDLQPQTQTSSHAASCVDGKKHSSEPNKAESTDNSLLALEQCVEEACALVERTLREREKREQASREIERKQREIRERKRREREAMVQEEAGRWPQQQEAITGRSQWLCEHYQRHCRVRFPCCGYFYSCHRCHNNSKACKNEEAKAHHATHLKCSFCQHEQEIGEDSGKCRSCGAQMSAYFCSICKHFTSVDKNPYHCKKCGICRLHKDKSFHCELCNVCLDKRLEGKHKCRPDSGHNECCISLEEGLQISAYPEDIVLVTTEENVTGACTDRVRFLKKQEEQTKRQSEVVQRQGEIREQRIREAREREDMAVAVLAPVEESPLWQCDHFQRHCRVRFPCCGVFYPCHSCHNGSGACDSRNKKANQAIDIKCTNCGHKEEINEGSQTCSSCGTRMSEYFCFKCKHFTGVDKNPFHCDKCGICRIHRDRAFHCDVCNVCLDKRQEGKHKCRPKHVGHKSKGKKQGSVTYSTDRENKENQGQQGDLLEDQCALQTERFVDAVPGDGHGVDTNNESNADSESTCNEEDVSAISDDAVLRLTATAASKSWKQIGHLENAVQECKKENKTLEALLEKEISESSRGDMADLPRMNAVCNNSSTTHLSVPAYRHFNTGVVRNVPLEPSLEPSLVDVVQGIDAVFLARHSQDPHLCESPQNTSSPEALPNMNEGSQACTERCRPDSGHDVCCECLEDVLNGLQFLPCPHHIHMECLIGMIQNGALNCPLCGRAFLRRG